VLYSNGDASSHIVAIIKDNHYLFILQINVDLIDRN